MAGEVFLVDRTFFRSWWRCPFAVAMLLGKFFRTRGDVRLGLMVKKPAVITVYHDETMGLKAALWRYCMMSDLVERVWTLFEHGSSLVGVYFALVRGVVGQCSKVRCRCYVYLLMWYWGWLNLIL